MPSTYKLISSNVLSSSAASVTFSAIPSTYTDLVVRFSVRADETGTTRSDMTLKINGTSANYSYTRLIGSGTAVTSTRVSSGTSFNPGDINAVDSTANTFTNGEIYIPSYLVSQNKPISSILAQENNATSAFIRAFANLWSNTEAITSLVFTVNGGFNYVSGSSFYLYGIKKD